MMPTNSKFLSKGSIEDLNLYKNLNSLQITKIASTRLHKWLAELDKNLILSI